MKIVSIIMGLAVLALVALTLVPAAADYRAYFAVAALVAASVLLGAHIVRVHGVREMADVVRVADRIRAAVP